MSAWGTSFGDAWGDSWGSLSPVITFVDLHDGGPKERKKYKAKQERLREQIREGFDPKPQEVEPVAIEAVSILPSRTEYVAIQAPEESDDELAIVMALA